MGVGVRDGVPRPDISTPEAFKATLLAAKSLVYVDPPRGDERHPLQQRARAPRHRRRGPGQDPAGGGRLSAEKVASGEAEVVVHQISEIVPSRAWS